MPCIERRRPPISRILFYLSVNSLRLALEPVGFVLSSLRDAFQSCSPRLFLILGITSCFIDIFIYLEHQHLESIFKSHLSDLLSFRLISSFQQNCSTDFGWLCRCCIFTKVFAKLLAIVLNFPTSPEGPIGWTFPDMLMPWVIIPFKLCSTILTAAFNIVSEVFQILLETSLMMPYCGSGLHGLV